MKIGQRRLLDEPIRRSEIFVGFTGESNHDVGANGGVRNPQTNARHKAGVVFRRVRTVHRPQNTRRSALQRNMKMMSHSRMSCGEVNKFGHHFERLDRTETQAGKTWNFKRAADQLVKARLGMKIAAVCAEMNSGKDYF